MNLSALRRYLMSIDTMFIITIVIYIIVYILSEPVAPDE